MGSRVSMRVLGIDPGYAIVGWGVIEQEGIRFKAVDFGAVCTQRAASARPDFRAAPAEKNDAGRAGAVLAGAADGSAGADAPADERAGGTDRTLL